MSAEKKPEFTMAQAYGILAAAHADAVVEARILRAHIEQLQAQLAALQPPPPAETKEPPTLEAVK